MDLRRRKDWLKRPLSSKQVSVRISRAGVQYFGKNRFSRTYFVVQFIELPYKGICNPVAVSHRWVRWKSKTKGLCDVAYPNEEDPHTELRAMRRQVDMIGITNGWKYYRAVIKYETESYEDAISWIASKEEEFSEKRDSSSKNSNRTSVEIDPRVLAEWPFTKRSYETFFVVQFIELPFHDIADLVPVPHFWVTVRWKQQIGTCDVVYPARKYPYMGTKVRLRMAPETYWRKRYRAIIKYSTEDYQDAISWIASKINVPCEEQCSETREQPESAAVDRKESTSRSSSNIPDKTSEQKWKSMPIIGLDGHNDTNSDKKPEKILISKIPEKPSLLEGLPERSREHPEPVSERKLRSALRCSSSKKSDDTPCTAKPHENPRKPKTRLAQSIFKKIQNKVVLDLKSDKGKRIVEENIKGCSKSGPSLILKTNQSITGPHTMTNDETTGLNTQVERTKENQPVDMSGELTSPKLASENPSSPAGEKYNSTPTIILDDHQNVQPELIEPQEILLDTIPINCGPSAVEQDTPQVQEYSERRDLPEPVLDKKLRSASRCSLSKKSDDTPPTAKPHENPRKPKTGRAQSQSTSKKTLDKIVLELSSAKGMRIVKENAQRDAGCSKSEPSVIIKSNLLISAPHARSKTTAASNDETTGQNTQVELSKEKQPVDVSGKLISRKLAIDQTSSSSQKLDDRDNIIDQKSRSHTIALEEIRTSKSPVVDEVRSTSLVHEHSLRQEVSDGKCKQKAQLPQMFTVPTLAINNQLQSKNFNHSQPYVHTQPPLAPAAGTSYVLVHSTGSKDPVLQKTEPVNIRTEVNHHHEPYKHPQPPLSPVASTSYSDPVLQRTEPVRYTEVTDNHEPYKQNRPRLSPGTSTSYSNPLPLGIEAANSIEVTSNQLRSHGFVNSLPSSTHCAPNPKSFQSVSKKRSAIPNVAAKKTRLEMPTMHYASEPKTQPKSLTQTPPKFSVASNFVSSVTGERQLQGPTGSSIAHPSTFYPRLVEPPERQLYPAQDHLQQIARMHEMFSERNILQQSYQRSQLQTQSNMMNTRFIPQPDLRQTNPNKPIFRPYETGKMPVTKPTPTYSFRNIVPIPLPVQELLKQPSQPHSNIVHPHKIQNQPNCQDPQDDSSLQTKSDNQKPHEVIKRTSSPDLTKTSNLTNSQRAQLNRDPRIQARLNINPTARLNIAFNSYNIETVSERNSCTQTLLNQDPRIQPKPTENQTELNQNLSSTKYNIGFYSFKSDDMELVTRHDSGTQTLLNRDPQPNQHQDKTKSNHNIPFITVESDNMEPVPTRDSCTQTLYSPAGVPKPEYTPIAENLIFLSPSKKKLVNRSTQTMLLGQQRQEVTSHSTTKDHGTADEEQFSNDVLDTYVFLRDGKNVGEVFTADTVENISKKRTVRNRNSNTWRDLLQAVYNLIRDGKFPSLETLSSDVQAVLDKFGIFQTCKTTPTREINRQRYNVLMLTVKLYNLTRDKKLKTRTQEEIITDLKVILEKYGIFEALGDDN